MFDLSSLRNVLVGSSIGSVLAFTALEQLDVHAVMLVATVLTVAAVLAVVACVVSERGSLKESRHE